MGFFKRSTRTVETDTTEEASAPEVPVKSDLGRNLMLSSSGRWGASEVKQQPATFDVETGQLTVFATYKNGDTAVLRYDLMSDPLHVKGHDGSYSPHLSVNNDNYKTYDSNFYMLEIAHDDLVEKPLFAAALREVLLRNQLKHSHQTVIETDLDTWDLKYTNRYRAANRLYLQDVADGLFDGMSMEDIRAHTTVTSDSRSVSTDRSDGEDATWTVILQQERKVKLAGETMSVDSSVVLSDHKGETVAEVVVKGPGFNCSYQLPVSGEGNLLDVMFAGLRPVRDYSRGVDMTNFSLEKDHGMGKYPGDRHYTQAFVRMTVEDWAPFYELSRDMIRKVKN